MRFRLSRTLSAAAALLFGLALTSVPTTAAAEAPPLNWQPCAFAPGFECATMKVPLDYDEPGGTTIDLAVIRRPALNPANRIGSMFFNPGGPGGSGVATLPLFYGLFPLPVLERFDVVSFDPRGINQSAGLQCFASKQEEDALLGRLPDGFPVGATEQQTWIDVFSEFAKACGSNGGPILTHMSTANVARDMDLLRQAVGDRKLNYYGPSYGTYLGATYANLFPDKVRAIILDANIDPLAWNDTWQGAILGTALREGSDLGSADTLRLFLDQCGAVDTIRCAFSAGSPQATRLKYATLLSRLRDKPVTVGLPPRTVTYAGAVRDTVAGLYVSAPMPGVFPGWKGLAQFLQELHNATTGRSAGVVFPPFPDWIPFGASASYVGPEQTYGVLCGESPNPRDPRSYARQGAFAAGRSGDPGHLWTWMIEPCAEWPATDADRYTGPFNKPTSAPILVIGVEKDPATPFSASEAMAKALANARLLKVAGGGHTALLNASTCARNHVVAYAVRGALPPRGTVCQQDQQPF